MYGCVVHKSVCLDEREGGRGGHGGGKHEPKEGPLSCRMGFFRLKTNGSSAPTSRVIVALPSSSAYNAGDIRDSNHPLPRRALPHLATAPFNRPPRTPDCDGNHVSSEYRSYGRPSKLPNDEPSRGEQRRAERAQHVSGPDGCLRILSV